MKNALIKIILLASIALIAYLILQPQPQKKHTAQEMENISAAFSQKFSKANERRVAQEKGSAENMPKSMPTSKAPAANTEQQMIIGVIYKKTNATWFFKAKDSKEKIETISASFKNYFVDQLKFDSNQQPDFSHIPDSMKTVNKSSMRIATYLISDVEISVSRLSGQQDVFANVKRWMKQVGLDDNSPIQLDFSDNKETIFVKMPK